MITKQLLFDNGRSFISHVRGTSGHARPLAITFAEMHLNDPGAPGFSEQFLSRAGHDMIVVQKNDETWYQDLTVEAFLGVVRPVAQRYPSCASYGVSMGAYASLYFTGALGARVLAISPLVSIHPGYPSLGHAKYRESVAYRHLPLAEVAPPAAGSMIIYDPTIARDLLYVGNEIVPVYPPGQIVPAPFLGHPCSHAMQEMGVLKELVLHFLEGRPVDVRGMVRSRRRHSLIYVMNLIRAAKRRRRTARAMRLAAHAQALFPASGRLDEMLREIGLR
jgi:hypothetical protein